MLLTVLCSRCLFSLRGLSLHREFFINSACWGAALRASLPPSRLTTYHHRSTGTTGRYPGPVPPVPVRYNTQRCMGMVVGSQKEARPPVHAIGRLRRGKFADGASRASATAVRLRPKKASMPLCTIHAARARASPRSPAPYTPVCFFMMLSMLLRSVFLRATCTRPVLRPPDTGSDTNNPGPPRFLHAGLHSKSIHDFVTSVLRCLKVSPHEASPIHAHP